MKSVWVRIVPWDKQKAISSLESGVDALIVPEGFSAKVKELGIIKTVASDGDIKLGEDVVEFEIKNKQDEEKALKLSRSKMLILRMKDWAIIPLENLIAQTEGLMVEVDSAAEARTAVQALEKGADGVVLDTADINEIRKVVQVVKGSSGEVKLGVVRIVKTEPLGMGDRVCIDTCTNMRSGEGILVGNTSDAMFLVHSESIENPYVEPRPFRVNAGAVHAYTLVPEGKTKYLSELKAGSEALVVNGKGETQVVVVGRIKVERRPLMLVEGETAEGKRVSLVLQNAETIRLIGKNGEAISVVDLKKDSEVMGYSAEGGRHFGIKIDETIVEK
jgi:3-dehydroquinate synthase II